jgi:asparaginyl-tRNA synthetase
MTLFSTIDALQDHVGATVTVRGWVAHVRSSGKVAFIVMRDGTGTVQAVVVKSVVSPQAWEAFGRLTHETSIAVTGEVRADARSPGGYELSVSDLQLLGESPVDYPIQPKEHGVDFLLDHRHLWRHRARTP